MRKRRTFVRRFLCCIFHQHILGRDGRLELPTSCSQSKRATNCANPGYEIQTDPTAGCSNSRVCLQNDYTTVPDRSTRGLPQKDGMQTKDYPLFY